MYVPSMICFTLVVSLLLAQTEGRAFNNAQSREKRQTSGCDGGQRYDNFGPISTNIGGEYGNNENCCWDIVPDVQGTWTITFQFDTFDVESSSGCIYDALTFNTDDGPVKECGQKTDFSRTFTVTGSQFQVCFSSDGSVTKEGVSGTYGIVSTHTTSYADYTTNYPEYTTSNPYYVTSYPEYTTSNPYYVTSYPDYGIYYPDYFTSYPEYTTSNPYYVTSYPEYTTSNPYYVTSYPEYTTSNPYYVTSYPEYTTSNPYYVTSYPDYGIYYPDYFTSYPEYTTSNPYYVTSYPEYTTYYPEYTTSYPDYATYYPEYTTAYPEYPQEPAMRNSSGCTGGEVSNSYGYFTTNGEDQYENNEQCCWHFQSPLPEGMEWRVDLELDLVDVELSTNCVYDALTFTWDNQTESSLCGRNITDFRNTFNVTGAEFEMCFRSDSSVTGRGVRGFYSVYPVLTLPPAEPLGLLGNTSYYGNHGSISINDDNNYSNNQDVCYLLRPSFTGSGIITFVFNVFDIEEATGCVFDYIEFDDVNTKLRECGTVDAGTQREFEFHDGRFNVCFHSDGSVTGRGIQATYSMNPVREVESVETTPYPVDVIFNATMSTNFTEATTLPVNTTVNATSLPNTEENTCTQVLTSDDGTLTSPGNGSYANNVQCVTVITGPSVPYTLVLSFTTFDLEDSSSCRYDYLEVDMGDGYSQKGCGSSWDNSTVEYISEGGNVTVTFSSDSSQTGVGYSATYTIQPRGVPSLNDGDCTYINTNVSMGVIQSLPGTGSNYPNNMNCSYVFTRNTPFHLDINFIALDIESSSGCSYDYVQVGDDKYCGSDLPNATRVSADDIATIRFRSDGSVTRKGFVALFSLVDDCNFDSEDLEGTYTLATNFLDTYDNNQHCDITLRSPSTPHITTVNFTRFDMEDDSGCDYDSLTITSDDATEKLCGAKESFIRQYTGPTVDMTFTSDGSVRRGGFSFNYFTDLVYCNATINATSGTFESQPGGYESNMYCTYTINTPTSGDLVFTFPLFDVERARSCRYDAVEMAGDKLCGTNIRERTYSTDGHFQFVFTSDGSVNGDGFTIDFSFFPDEIQY
ncbi:cubilin-like isoform X2 [Haliotis cracherodii]|uniref:cubilin-like isoform X2 n=1 Tax=Haliotis cracherodii TaxID=6455 RepID=UPI0039EAC4B4